MYSARAIYDGKQLTFLEKISLDKPQQVIVVFLENETRKEENSLLTEIAELAAHTSALAFLQNEEEDIYSDSNLKLKY